MDVIIKNIKKKDFPVLKSLAKSFGFEIIIKEVQPADAKTALGKEEKIKKIIKEIDEQWE